MKSYTDLEQSKKLAEILPPESANMYYKYVLPKSDKIHHIPEIGNPINSLKWYNEGYTFRGRKELITLNEYCVPAWSLAALLESIPQEIFEGEYIINITEGLDNKWVITYDHYDNRNSFYGLSTGSDNLVDSCVDLLTKLKERNII